MTDGDSLVGVGPDAVADVDAATVGASNEGRRSVTLDEPPVETGALAADRQAAGYATQVGAYDRRPQADALADRLADAGYPAYVVEARQGPDRSMFRVRIGDYPDRQAAEAVGRRLQDEEALDWYVVRLP